VAGSSDDSHPAINSNVPHTARIWNQRPTATDVAINGAVGRR
jgi:hypothetical protein